MKDTVACNELCAYGLDADSFAMLARMLLLLEVMKKLSSMAESNAE